MEPSKTQCIASGPLEPPFHTTSFSLVAGVKRTAFGGVGDTLHGPMMTSGRYLRKIWGNQSLNPTQ